MKLVLCSEGFHTENTVQACVDLCGKPQDEVRVAVINEAFAIQPGDKRWVLRNLNSVSEKFPAELDLINLLALDIEQVEQSISAADVIFVVGGNPDFLMHTFNKTGFSKLLPKLLEDKVYVGSSAGSMVMGHRLATETIQYLYEEDPYSDVGEYLGLVDLAVLPHLDSDNFPTVTRDSLSAKVQETGFDVYGISDDAAIVFDGDVCRFIGSQAYKI